MYVVLSGRGLVSPHAMRVVSDNLMTLLPALGSAFAFSVAIRRKGRARRGWALLGAWGILSATGNAIYTYYDLILKQPVPLPSLADAGYLGGNLCAVAAIATFAVAHERGSKIRTVLDSLLIAASVFLVSWALLLRTVYEGSTGSVFTQSVGLAYPVVDIIIVSLIVFVASRSLAIGRVPLLVIGVGLLGWAFADSAFAYLTTIGAYHPGGPVDAGWIGGDALLALAGILALHRPAKPDEHAEPRFSQWRVFLPYAVTIVALVITVTEEVVRPGVDILGLSGSIVLLALVVARQFVMVIENKSMTIEHMHSVDAMKDGILHAVSHELRTPLTVIKGFAEMIRDQSEMSRDDVEHLLDRLLSNCDRLEDFLTGLLDLERLSRGVLEPARRDTELDLVFLRAVDIVYAPVHNVEIVRGGVSALVDPAQTERIVENLVVNAVRHTPPGTNITARAERAPGGVVLTVTDNGPGVADDLKNAIFHAFEQGPDSGDMGNGKGTGIGLALVAKFAELHGGRAWVEDTPGGGACFRVFLGVPEQVPDEPKEEPKEEPSETAA